MTTHGQATSRVHQCPAVPYLLLMCSTLLALPDVAISSIQINPAMVNKQLLEATRCLAVDECICNHTCQPYSRT